MLPSTEVRTRFAPSPTGPLHIGGARSAIFSWLLARRYGGQFILRLEDTDRKRYVPGSEERIFAGLRWLGLDWDEGPDIGGPYAPYVQSQRLANYQQIAEKLVRNGYAYRCFCSSQRLAQVNQEKNQRGEAAGYDRVCRAIKASDAEQRAANGEIHVIRLRVPLDDNTECHDLIRGVLHFDNSQLQDVVLLKSDGYPTYHLAVVVDDHHMQISHVTRAVEWLPSFPLHTLLWRALGWRPPHFAHLPVLLNPNGKGKLSKRHTGFQMDGQTVPVLVHEFQEMGYYGLAVTNFLTNIGWAFGNEREIFSLDEASARFDITRVNPANSAFPVDKLRWLNGVYIRERIPNSILLEQCRSWLEAAGYSVEDELLRKVLPIVKDRIKTFADVVDIGGFFFAGEFLPPQAELFLRGQMTLAEVLRAIQGSIQLITANASPTVDTMHTQFRDLAKRLGVKNGLLFGCLRLAITGRAVSPPIFETMAIIGSEECLRRLQIAKDLLLATAAD